MGKTVRFCELGEHERVRPFVWICEHCVRGSGPAAKREESYTIRFSKVPPEQRRDLLTIKFFRVWESSLPFFKAVPPIWLSINAKAKTVNNDCPLFFYPRLGALILYTRLLLVRTAFTNKEKPCHSALVCKSSLFRLCDARL